MGVTANAFVVVAVGSILAYLTNDRFAALRKEIERLRAETTEGLGRLRAEMTEGLGGLRAEIGEVRTELKGGIARLEDRVDAGLASVHAEIVQVALAVGARGKAAEG